MTPPFFIIGTQRSGTTLLFQMLNNHPDLCVVNELWYFYPHLTGTDHDADKLAQFLISELRLPEPYLSPGAALPTDPFDHLDLAFAAKLRCVAKPRWGLKDPHLTYHLDRFREHYPQAKFLFIVRDARGVTNSYLSRKMNVANVYFGAKLWVDEVRLQTEFMRRFPERSYAVRFEDLLKDPERELHPICDFLGVEYRDVLLEYYRFAPATTLHDGNINITKPIRSSIADKWHTELSARQIAIVETIAGETMRAQGYQPNAESAPITWLHRLGYRFHQWVMTNYWWQQRSNWEGIRGRVKRLLGRGTQGSAQK